MSAPAAEAVKSARAMYITLSNLVVFDHLPAPLRQALSFDALGGRPCVWLTVETEADAARWAAAVNADHIDAARMHWGRLDGWHVVIRVLP
jgi:hypothetical protein